MGIVLVRVDDRLVHGQTVEAWAPFCKATGIVVASDEAKKNRIQKIAIESCSSNILAIKVEGIEELLGDRESSKLPTHPSDGRPENLCCGGKNTDRVIVIFSTLKDLMQAYNKGLRFSHINIGNIHHNGKGKKLTPSVYLDKEDEDILQNLLRLGVEVDIRAVPSDRPVDIVALLH